MRTEGHPSALVDREEELAALGGALCGVREGEAGLVVVEGDPGIGKTRLLAAARSEASRLGLRASGRAEASSSASFPSASPASSSSRPWRRRRERSAGRCSPARRG